MLGSPTGWDVRFALIKYTVDKSSVKAARTCGNAGSGASGRKARGAHGIGFAGPDENVWYRSYDLPSPQNRTIGTDRVCTEWRTAICAVLPSRALRFCTTRSGAGLSTDGADGSKRKEQTVKLQETVHPYTRPGCRTVYGGDLNSTPPDSASTDVPKDVVTSAYVADKECDEGLPAARSRDGRATKPLATRGIKVDYLSGPSVDTVVPCDVTAGADDPEVDVVALVHVMADAHVTVGGLDGDLTTAVDALVVVVDGRGAPVANVVPDVPAAPRHTRRQHGAPGPTLL
ncbi:hypothetical protein [Streptomyces sp. NPDC093071]|uniref:hypothetical protein n=1 Tax=Streptomyces sp. NPDC093071 TaxID=3366022 RepID=UPI00381FEE2A